MEVAAVSNTNNTPLSRGFDPEWPHGFEIVTNVSAERVTVLTWDRPNRAWPIVVMTGDGFLYSVSPDGSEVCQVGGYRVPLATLRNTPAPRASGTVWLKVYCDGSHDTFFRKPEKSGALAIKQIDWTEGDGLEPQPTSSAGAQP